MTLWLGLSILSIGGQANADLRTLAQASVTPIWSFVFLLFTSLMLLEKRADAKWGGRPAYEAYKARTPVLVPFL